MKKERSPTLNPPLMKINTINYKDYSKSTKAYQIDELSGVIQSTLPNSKNIKPVFLFTE